MVSDSDDDPDYVPPKPNDEDGDASDVEPVPKRARTDAEPGATTSEGTANKKTGEEVYAEFKASLNAPPSPVTPALATPKMVTIVKRYRFAGEEITDIKEVPADSEEARKWPLRKPSDETASTPGSSTVTSSPDTASAGPAARTSPPATSTPAKTPGKRPGPRKARSKLADVPKKEPLKKLTTLDKSAMDWRAHVGGEGSSDVKDELEANRRGGGYLEKVEFLQRVEARKEEVLDANKGKRRR